jgi:DNA-binding NtrC family response regulator
VRILAATNRNLERRVQQNLFRGDLYFRLAVILLHLPPLRERGEDIALLAEHFLRRFSSKYGKGTRRIDDRARQALMAYPWPGNVRELSHVIERAVLWSRDQILTVDDLSLATPLQLSGTFDGASAVPEPEAVSNSPAEPPGSDLTQWERSLIERAMREAGGNQTRAAQRLGITRDTLRYRLKKFGLHGG